MIKSNLFVAFIVAISASACAGVSPSIGQGEETATPVSATTSTPAATETVTPTPAGDETSFDIIGDSLPQGKFQPGHGYVALNLTFCAFNGDVEVDGIDVALRAASDGALYGGDKTHWMSDVKLVASAGNVLMGPVDFQSSGGSTSTGLRDPFIVKKDSCISAYLEATVQANADDAGVVGHDYYLSVTGFHSDALSVTTIGSFDRGVSVVPDSQ